MALGTYSTSWRANQHVLARLISDRIDQTLHAIEGFITFESPFAKAIHLRYLNKLASLSKGSNLAGRN